VPYLCFWFQRCRCFHLLHVVKGSQHYKNTLSDIFIIFLINESICNYGRWPVSIVLIRSRLLQHTWRFVASLQYTMPKRSQRLSTQARAGRFAFVANPRAQQTQLTAGTSQSTLIDKICKDICLPRRQLLHQYNKSRTSLQGTHPPGPSRLREACMARKSTRIT
jgi:hypothetical protein